MSFIISSYNWWARIYRILQQTDLLWFTIYIKERFYNLGIVGKCQKLSNKMVANMIEILYFWYINKNSSNRPWKAEFGGIAKKLAVSKVQNFADIIPNIPFTEFDFYDLYKSTFEKRGRPFSEEKKEKDLVRRELARVRATAKEGSFGTQKEH